MIWIVVIVLLLMSQRQSSGSSAPNSSVVVPDAVTGAPVTLQAPISNAIVASPNVLPATIAQAPMIPVQPAGAPTLMDDPALSTTVSNIQQGPTSIDPPVPIRFLGPTDVGGSGVPGGVTSAMTGVLTPAAAASVGADLSSPAPSDNPPPVAIPAVGQQASSGIWNSKWVIGSEFDWTDGSETFLGDASGRRIA